MGHLLRPFETQADRRTQVYTRRAAAGTPCLRTARNGPSCAASSPLTALHPGRRVRFVD